MLSLERDFDIFSEERRKHLRISIDINERKRRTQEEIENHEALHKLQAQSDPLTFEDFCRLCILA